MRRRLGHTMRLLLAAVVLMVVPGCYDRLDLEEAGSPFLVGYDLDKNDQMLVYVMTPLFGKEEGKPTQKIDVEAKTSREAREKEDARSAGVFQGRKIQIILIGKRMLEHDDWFQMLDVFFRDSRNSLTPRVVVFDGEISDIVYLDRKEKPMLPMLLREMIVTKSGRTESTKTNLQELHRQIYEKGMTPYVPQVGLEHDEIALQGTALLDHRAKLAVSLNIQETVLLLMLQKEANHSTSLTIPVPGEWKKGPFHKNRLSFSMQKVKTTIGTSYANDRFQFDIRVDMRIALTELLFPYHTDKEQKQLEKKIASQVQKLIEDLIAKIQKHRVDPLGLGVYARAYAYKPYKQAEEHWGQAVADSNIRVKVHVEIGSTGPVK